MQAPSKIPPTTVSTHDVLHHHIGGGGAPVKELTKASKTHHTREKILRKRRGRSHNHSIVEIKTTMKETCSTHASFVLRTYGRCHCVRFFSSKRQLPTYDPLLIPANDLLSFPDLSGKGTRVYEFNNNAKQDGQERSS
eukprot:scaffold346_cov116-Cylindrotheca_fusiformis.AAC.8